ncbi:MAG: 3'(2'),5'-bisphosphate nucleotidase CysQ, partial [Clostridia bacterium]|nr:3'(2'),5'-bisphosphate nucleotidase CysQ [Clostridia bacterium]
MKLSKELEIAKEAAVEAGHIILEIYNQKFKIDYKEDQSPVTQADRLADEAIVNRLKNEFPQYAVLSEESKDDLKRLENDWCWIVDPLDGTKEFIKKNGEFTVNIALTFEHRVVLGVVYIPVKKALFYAVKGEGAFLEEKGEVQRIKVSHREYNIRAACSRSHTSEKLKRILHENGINHLVFAGSALKGCMIAKGDAEIYYRYGKTSEWDTAALQCVVE